MALNRLRSLISEKINGDEEAAQLARNYKVVTTDPFENLMTE